MHSLIDLTHLVICHCAASLNVKSAPQIGNACMAAYENKLPQGFYNKISSYVVTIDTPMKGINLGAVTTVDIEVVFNRTLGIIRSEEFDLHEKSLVTKRDKRQSEKIELLPRKHRQ